MPWLRVVRSHAGLLLLLLLILAGCSSKGDSRTVSGVVKYQGTLVPGGTIAFFPVSDKDKEKVARAGINEDGSYKILDCPEGDVKITVEGPHAPSDVKKGKTAPMVLPKKYLKPDTSGLTYTVKEGAQTYDVDLK